VHVWSGEEYGSTEEGTYQTVSAPLGEPAVFYREGSVAGAQFREELEDHGLLQD
jgi:alpha-glucosidase (family GH31 glycosyl hydrolase)